MADTENTTEPTYTAHAHGEQTWISDDGGRSWLAITSDRPGTARGTFAAQIIAALSVGPSAPTEPTDEQVEAAARAMAILDDYDGCFLRVDEWNALEQWERDAHPEEEPLSDMEDCARWRKWARAALSVAPSAPTEDDREALIEFMHARQEFEYDSCDHGTYNGGPMHGQPYKMCERWADAFLRDRPVLARRSPVPPSASIDPAPILTYADQCEAADPVNQLAIVLMRAWGEADPRSNVAQHYGSYLATFADMARAALDFAPSAPTPDVAALIAEAEHELSEAASAATPNQARRILAGEAADSRLSLIARLIAALRVSAPETGETRG